MLKRSKLLIAFLVVTVICASIGFAAVSDTLNAGGKVSVNATNSEAQEQFEANIKFSAVDKEEYATIDTEGDTLTITLPDTVLQKETDTYTVTATVSNENATDASFTVSEVTNAASKWISITAVAENGETTIAGGGTVKVVITFTLDTMPAGNITEAAFSFTVKAEAIDQ